LVGLTNKQIVGFHWKPEKQRDFARPDIEKRLERALAERRSIREADDFTPEPLLSQKLEMANEALAPLRRDGDLVIAAYFAADNDKARVKKLDEIAETLAGWVKNPEVYSLHGSLQAMRRSLVEGSHSLEPLHWEIEFPEVFDRENPGFDAFVGNPPFMGAWNISPRLGESYLHWLLSVNTGAHGNCDLVAHFFRHVFRLLRRMGTLGLVATNTIAQGDTQSSGLAVIFSEGGEVFACERRLRWPGQAAVVVSTVHIVKGTIDRNLQRVLDGKAVRRISAYLLEGTQDSPPPQLANNKNRSFSGATIYGYDFILTPEEVTDLVSLNPRNAERIMPYLGGEEINSDPKSCFYRYVINFGTMSLEEAGRWPELLSIVEVRVKPERDAKTNNAIALRQKQYWWRFRSDTPFLKEAVASLSRCLAASRISSNLAFSFQPTHFLFSDGTNVFAIETWAGFSVLQSRPHELWARFLGSSMKDDLRYGPSDCFETFPFPMNFETDPSLEAAGQAYYDFRAALMVRNNEGLTKTYNRFHDPDERSPDILKLRELHAAMDRAVLDAYGWTDLKPTCEFLLDYQEDEDDEDEAGRKKSKKKKPWRYRWPDDFRDEVLARLLELNRQRAEEERLSGAGAEKSRPPSKKRKSTRRALPKNEPDLPGFH